MGWEPVIIVNNSLVFVYFPLLSLFYHVEITEYTILKPVKLCVKFELFNYSMCVWLQNLLWLTEYFRFVDLSTDLSTNC